MNWIETPCEQIDAAVFTGEALWFDEQRAMLKDYIGRWQRAIREHEEANPDAGQDDSPPPPPTPHS